MAFLKYTSLDQPRNGKPADNLPGNDLSRNCESLASHQARLARMKARLLDKEEASKLGYPAHEIEAYFK